jgi:type II secretory pathway pseudopilin PulG
MSNGRAGRRPARGFTYISLIILVAIIGLVAATTLKTGAMLQRSAAERELLDVGAQFSDALQSYANATPAGQPAQPPSLQELLKDPRYPGVRRHLRKIFVDPMTGKAEWGIVYLADKVGVIAVYSLSDAKPIKVSNFPSRFQAFDGKLHISDWKFTMTGNAATATAVVTPQPNPSAAPSNSPTQPANPPQNPVSPYEAPVSTAAPEAPATPPDAPNR